MPDIQSILDPVQMPKNVKADAFDAYQSASSSDDLQKRLDKLPLPQKVKADLWDAKQAEGGGAGPAAPVAPAGEAPGFWNHVGQVAGGAWDALNPLPAAKRYLIDPTVDIVQGLHDGNHAQFERGIGRINPVNAISQDIVNAQIGQGKQAVSDFQQGHYSEAAGHGLAAALPLLGPAAAQAGEMIGDGQPYRGVGQALGTIGQVLIPDAVRAVKDSGVIPAAGAATHGFIADKATALMNRVVDQNPRPLSPGATALAADLDVPLTRGMQGGSKTVQAAEKMLGHSVAPDLYEPLVQSAQQGVTAGAKNAAGGFATDRFTAGQNVLDSMLKEAQGHEDTAQTEYGNLRTAEADPENARTVQVGMKANPSQDPGAPERIPDMQPVAMPTDIRPFKQAVAPFVDEVMRRMTPAQRNTDPGLSALQNILTRPDALPVSVAEADLGYLKDIQRSDATPQAKRLATIGANALQPAIDSAVSIAGPDAVRSLQTARGSWAARSSILDQVKGLANDTTGRTGQVLLANKLLQPADASYPALEQVLNVAPGAAQDLGKAYLTERVFKKVSQEGADFTNPTQAQNVWNQIGPRTKAALYTPDQITGMNDLLELAKRVAENPNPSGTGIINTLLKMGVMLSHPVGGVAGFAIGRSVAKLLYYPDGMNALKTAVAQPGTGAGVAAAAAVSKMMSEPPPVPPPDLPTNETTNANPNTPVDAGATQPRATLPQPAGAGGEAAPTSQTSVTVPGDSRQYTGSYQLRELSDVRPSHSGISFQPNPQYQLLNDRNYDNPVNQAKIVNWSAPGAGGFDPSELVNDARNSSTGPPVLDSTGNVLGGNGRGMIMQRVYKSNPAGAQAYRDLLTQKAAQFGVDPAQVASMKQPVLTRVLDDENFSGDAQKQAAITDFNKSGTAALTPSERAIADSRRVSTSTLSGARSR